jgi:hypothetical protein
MTQHEPESAIQYASPRALSLTVRLGEAMHKKDRDMMVGLKGTQLGHMMAMWSKLVNVPIKAIPVYGEGMCVFDGGPLWVILDLDTGDQG